MQSVLITDNAVSLNPTHVTVYSIQCYMIRFSVTCDRSMVFSNQ